jgi:periplasmic protein TonB
VRTLPAVLGALLITLAVFLFMQSLIERGREEGVQLEVYNNVDIVRIEPEELPPPEEQESEPTPVEEPALAPLEVAPVSPPNARPSTELELPALELGVGDINIAAVGKGWSAPLGGAGVEVQLGGADAHGYVEVVPFDTRRPNVPEVAWQNKINGWVLVAFSVTADGRTRGVRVLDASPRGVFEEKVIAAVEDWTYRISFSGKAKGDVVLTQKVEVQWKNYPRNLPNVD